MQREEDQRVFVVQSDAFFRNRQKTLLSAVHHGVTVSMKRRRPQWQSLCTMLTLAISGTALVVYSYASGEAEYWERGRMLQTVPPVLQPIPPPTEVNVTSSPTWEPSESPNDCGGCPPPVASTEPEPTEIPSFAPVVSTPMPTTPKPTREPTPQPIEPQTPQPVEPQTPQPVEPKPVTTPQPSDLQTLAPVTIPEPTNAALTNEPTQSPFEPQTTEPTAAPVVQETPAPVVEPTPAPVVEPTPAPTRVPTISTEPTTTAPIPSPTLPQISKPPTSTVAEVPMVPFVLSLEFDEPQTGTAEDLEVLSLEVDRILSNYLFDVMNEQISYEGVMLEDVDLTVTPQLSRSDNVFEGRRRLRALQEQVLSFDVTGKVVYQIAGDANVTEEELAQKTNDVVTSTMEDPQTLNDLTEAFQASKDSETLRSITNVSAKVEEPPNDNGITKPTKVAIVFGWLLVALGVVGICMYAWAFYKKRRKKALQRKRDRQRGLNDDYPNGANRTASMASMNSSINRSRSHDSKVLVLPPTEFEGDSSESEWAGSASAVSATSSAGSASGAAGPVSTTSSGISGQESEASTKSDFTRELELAASLDRRSWIEMQKKRSLKEQERGSIQYPSQYAVEGVEMQEVSADGSRAVGAAAAGVATGVIAAAAFKSYPYGDEKDSDDDSVDLSEVKNADGEDLFFEGEDGIEWTTEGVWSPYDGYQKRDAAAADKSRSSMSSVTDSRSGKQRSVWAKSWSSIDSFRQSRKREPKDPNSFMKSWSSIDSARQSANRDSAPRNISMVEEASVEEVVVEAAEHAAEAEEIESRATETAPTVSSAGTSNAVRMSPTASAVTEVVVSQRDAVEEKRDEDEDSVLTQDIVKEVHRLARFVRKYDKKRERKLLKDREREEKAALAINEAQSFPSVGYDAMSDSISALRKGPVEASSRRERTALANPVEETDESNSSERSWSTTSNANAPVDDEDDLSAPITIDDSEIDVSDSSVDDEPSESKSDTSRLGITPFSIQRVVGMPQSSKPEQQSRRADLSSPEAARPPVSRKQNNSKGLPPLPTTPGSPDEDSPEKTHTPVHSVKEAMMRVNSARQKKFGQRYSREQPPTKRSRESELTEDALQELSDSMAADLSSPYQQQKGALATLRKNNAILDTASSHFTEGVEGVTSSQYEQAFKVGVISQQEQRRAYLARNSFRRAAQDPPAERAESDSLQATDEKRSPRWETKTQGEAVEMRIPPSHPPPQAQSRAMPAAAQNSSEMRGSHTQPTQRKAPFKVQSATQLSTPQMRTNSPSPVSTSSGTKRAAPEAAPATQTPRSQETAPAPKSPAAIQSPPRRKSKRGSAFTNVVNMFESKPKNAIFPPSEGWQYNC